VRICRREYASRRALAGFRRGVREIHADRLVPLMLNLTR